MKSLLRILFAAAVVTAATGCEKSLDINENPNNATFVTPDAQLATALVRTAANYHGGGTIGGVGRDNYNSYSSFVAGFWGKSGTVSGFSQERTYNYTTNYYQNLWNDTYDNLNDYELVQKNGTAQGYPNHAAIARIMKVYNFLLLVDEYGDIPYSKALKGLDNTSPAYDKAADIYKDFVVQLKGAVNDINAVPAGSRTVGNEDVVFNGGMTNWKRFANSLRLRILLRESSTNDAALNAYVATEMTALEAEADGFITTDVQVQPTYTANTDQQNPFYDRYGFAPGAIRANSEYSFVMPTKYIIRQYEANGDGRITQLYRRGLVDSVSAYSGTDLGEQTPPTFVPTNRRVGSRFLVGGTFLRGPIAPTLLMLLSEHLFSKAEAESRNLITGGDAAAKLDFMNGIKSSFNTTFRDGATNPATLTAATTGLTQYTAYTTAPANLTNGLVTWEAVTTVVPEGIDASQAPLTTPRAVSKTDKILYQKYLAGNTVASTEAWADYRRTAQPKFKISLQRGGNTLPTRLLYPQTEVSTNAANIPVGVTQFTKIFWDVLD